jgi:hypothetical protein
MRIVACILFLGLSTAAIGAEPAQKKTAAPPAKVSASQLFLRLDAIDKKIDDMTKAFTEAKTAATKAPALPAAPVPVQVVTTGESTTARGISQAIYSCGLYGQKAANTRLAARWIRDIALVAGAGMAVVGWEAARDKTNPRTFDNAFSKSSYSLFSSGVSTAALGVIISEFISMAADGLEAKAARALMVPLESAPEPARK